MEPVIVTTTTNKEREAKQLAATIIEKKLAACVQIIPKINSIYEWEGKIRDDQEYLLLIKTSEKLVRKLNRFIEENHSYEVPEFLVTPVIGGSDEYLDWIKDVTK
jgi:periplasmic divalent cation tolerance protein